MIEISDVAIEDILRDKGFVVAHPKGVSMRPFLRADDTIVLVRSDGIVKPWDCVLFKREDGVLVLHRVIKVGSDKVLTRGDHEKNYDAPVPLSSVLAVMTEFYRGKKHVFVDDPKYIKKTRRWNGKGRSVRLFFYNNFLRALSLPKRIFDKLFKRNKKDRS